MTDDLDFYDLLGVDRDATQEEIRSAFRGQVREYHPDRNDDPRAPAQFTAIKKAYDTLADPEERKAYDRMGHGDYVSDRISGLPSPDHWQVPGSDAWTADESGVDSGTSRSTGTTGARQTSRTSGTGAGGTESSSRSSGSGSADRTSSTGNPGSPEPASTWGSTEPDGPRGARSSVHANGDPGPTNSATSRSTPGSDPGSSAATNTAWTGTSPAGSGPVSGRNPGGTDGRNRRRTTGRAGVVETVHRWFHESNLGWPLIFLADLLYLAGMGTYLAANSTGVGRLVDALAVAGTNTAALQRTVAAPSRYGIESLPAFVRADIANPTSIGAALALAGMAFLPSVYMFIIHETRRTRTPWQPSYLYVVAALAPILGVVATLFVDLPGVTVEVVCYVVLPVATMVGLPFSAFVRPRMMREVRRVWWKVRG